jgi:hypothetical protein
MLDEPVKLVRLIEILSQRFASGRANVDCAPRVVLTEARRGVDREDGVDRQTGCQLFLKYLTLIVDASKPRHQEKMDIVATRRLYHSGPGPSRLRSESLYSSAGIYPDLNEVFGVEKPGSKRIPPVIRRNPECAMDFRNNHEISNDYILGGRCRKNLPPRDLFYGLYSCTRLKHEDTLMI